MKKYLGDEEYWKNYDNRGQMSGDNPIGDCDYPEDVDKKSWDTMVEYTCYFLTMLFFLAVIGIVLMMIKDVI